MLSRQKAFEKDSSSRSLITPLITQREMTIIIAFVTTRGCQLLRQASTCPTVRMSPSQLNKNTSGFR
jgi:hypothetical protein